MITYKQERKDLVKEELDGDNFLLLNKKKYEQFSTDLMGLGEMTEQTEPVEAIAAVFDLQGFTKFSSQVDSHLSVPPFLKVFLTWLVEQIKVEMTNKTYDFDLGEKLYGPLPFLVKFMGDGLLVLWDASKSDAIGHENVIICAYEVCEKYKTEFLPNVDITAPPKLLRCGLARGKIYSVGSNGNDFAGSCINIASRIEKLPSARFAFNLRGFEPKASQNIFFKEKFIYKKVDIRGIGHDERVAILNEDYSNMSEGDKEYYNDIESSNH